MTSNKTVEIWASAKLLSMAVVIEEQHGERVADWDMFEIWRAFEKGELNEYFDGILYIDVRNAAQTVHAAPHGSKVAALIGCASKALECLEMRLETLMRKGANFEEGTHDENQQRKLQNRNAD